MIVFNLFKHIFKIGIFINLVIWLITIIPNMVVNKSLTKLLPAYITPFREILTIFKFFFLISSSLFTIFYPILPKLVLIIHTIDFFICMSNHYMKCFYY